MKVTIRDVAKEAGVSIATVSRVINGSDKVSPETKKKVIKAIRKLGYKPSRLVKPLIGKEPKIVGILVPDIFAYHYSDIAESAIEILRENGYEVFVYTFHRTLEEELLAIDYSFMSRVEGLIVCTSEEDDAYLKALRDIAIPIVTIDRENKDFRFDSVNIDNYKAGKTVAEYLRSKGHSKVIHITGDMNTYSVRYRARGFAKKAEKLGMEIEIIEGSFEIGHAYDLTMKRVKEDLNFTAIFTSADFLALEVMSALNDLSISVPEEVSVMGFDDAYFSRYTIPKLTTVKQPRSEMGMTAAKLLLERLNSEKLPLVRKMILPVEIIERESVKDLK